MAKRKIEKTSIMQKHFAMIFGVIGISLLVVSGLNLTGGVIGKEVGKNLFLSLIGTVSLVASLVLFVKR